MNKKITAIIVCAAIAILIPILCIASDTEAWKNNTGTINLDQMTVTGEGIKAENNTVYISKGGDFTVTGTLEDGMIQVNTEEKVKLRLSGMSLTNTKGPAIFFENTEKGFITITEGTENFLADSAEYSIDDADAALFSNDDLEIKGDGALTVTGSYKHGIASDDDLKIENGTINVTSYEHGLKSNNTVNIIGGTLDITAKTGKGIKAGEELIIDAGTINIVSIESEGIESKGILTINGGDINITAEDDGINTGNEDTTGADANGEAMPIPSGMPQGEPPQRPEGEMPNGEAMPMPSGEPNGEMPQGGRGGRRGMGGQMPNGEAMPMPSGEPPQRPEGRMPQGEPPQMPSGENMPMPGGMPNGEMPQRPEGGMPQGGGMGGGFGMVDEETAKAHAVTINGGNIYINANGDGIDSNGNLTINGGTIVIDGPENNGNGPIDAQGTMEINGGDVITLSSAGMVQQPRDTEKVNILKVYFANSGVAGDVVTVKSADGTEVMSHTAVKSYSALIYSSDELKENSEYSVYVNGELYETATITKGTTTVGNAMMGSRDFGGGMGNRGNRG